jgi:hypothetical protein
VFLLPTEGNVKAMLSAAPDKKLTGRTLKEAFGDPNQLLKLLCRMRSNRQLTFNDGWASIDTLVVSLD